MAQEQAEGRDPGRLKRRYVVSGRVQGVGFRYFVLRHAQAAGVDGSVRNLMTGQVEVRALGTREQLGKLETALWKGPRFSNVTNVEIVEILDEIDLGSGFDISD